MNDIPNINDIVSLLRTNGSQLVDIVRLMSRVQAEVASYTPEQLAQPQQVQVGEDEQGNPVYETRYTNGTPEQWAWVQAALVGFTACAKLLQNQSLTGLTGDHMFALKKFLPIEKRGSL